MTTKENDPLWKMMGMLFQPHPWHGIPIGDDAPEKVTVFIEIVPTDTVKYEIEKVTGYLKVDRPQRFSNVCPTMYGLIPRTFCAERVAELSARKTKREKIIGDGDPLDICVLSEKAISHGGFILEAIPIGGLRMIDGEEADDKIIAVMKGDAIYGGMRNIHECPPQIIERLQHYFLTYKDIPGALSRKCEITDIYGKEEAYDVISRSQADYQAYFGNIEEMLTAVLRS